MTDTVYLTSEEHAERERIRQARTFVHQRVCHNPDLVPAPCVMCPTPTGLRNALAVLDTRPRDARAARRALHDVVCMSGCGPESDHADRTQAKAAAALRKFRAQEG